MSLSERLKEARTKKGLSQSDLAKKVKLHYTQIGRYENKGAQPSADILSKLADALDVTTDYLMSGSQDEMAEGISDKELMTQFKRIAKLPKEKKAIVKELLDAFLLKNDLKEKLAQ
ncbi:MAG TPA: helix-turn-helix transcriptional regulator [Chryseosolibacter sp.]|jgi:transcriptional regulator with XRE-family HTH domain